MRKLLPCDLELSALRRPTNSAVGCYGRESEGDYGRKSCVSQSATACWFEWTMGWDMAVESSLKWRCEHDASLECALKTRYHMVRNLGGIVSRGLELFAGVR